MDAVAKFVHDFKSLAYGCGNFEAWDALISSMAYICSPERPEWLLKRRDGALSNVRSDALHMVDELFGQVTDMLEANPKQDLLGDLYMRIGIANKENGQFFTPYHVAEASARLNLTRDMVDAAIEEKGYVTVNDPTAGGGSMLIAAANVLRDMGYNYQTQAIFMAQELSELTALSCFVQMSLLGMPGCVEIGDTLAMRFHAFLFTPMFMLQNVWHWRALAKACA